MMPLDQYMNQNGRDFYSAGWGEAAPLYKRSTRLTAADPADFEQCFGIGVLTVSEERLAAREAEWDRTLRRNRSEIRFQRHRRMFREERMRRMERYEAELEAAERQEEAIWAKVS